MMTLGVLFTAAISICANSVLLAREKDQFLTHKRCDQNRPGPKPSFRFVTKVGDFSNKGGINEDMSLALINERTVQNENGCGDGRHLARRSRCASPLSINGITRVELDQWQGSGELAASMEVLSRQSE
jgi:hypothetical protein